MKIYITLTLLLFNSHSHNPFLSFLIPAHSNLTVATCQFIIAQKKLEYEILLYIFLFLQNIKCDKKLWNSTICFLVHDDVCNDQYNQQISNQQISKEIEIERVWESSSSMNLIPKDSNMQEIQESHFILKCSSNHFYIFCNFNLEVYIKRTHMQTGSSTMHSNISLRCVPRLLGSVGSALSSVTALAPISMCVWFVLQAGSLIICVA